MLPDGRVLVTGGVAPSGRVLDEAEVFDTKAMISQTLQSPGIIVRAGHTSTTLSDGRVLIVGGTDASGSLITDAELWDPTRGTTTAIPGLPAT
jgi:hypothetical protein